MEIDALRALPAEDQRVFLLGRVSAEATSMEAALRFLWAALQGRRDVSAFLAAPAFFSSTVKECRQFVDEHTTLEQRTGIAVQGALDVAHALYQRRNRFIHDLLQQDLLGQEWELLRIAQPKPDEPPSAPASLEGMVEFVRELVAAKYRLRGCGMYALTGRWESLAFGDVVGRWDGSADMSL